MQHTCLNCHKVINGKFCNNCSQSISTRRFSLNHIFHHDFIHGIFHFDKGFFYTIKELFSRPGHSIREYVEGKRVKHFNYFATIIFLLTIGYFIKQWTIIDATILYDDEKAVSGLLKVLKDYSKITVFLQIPFISLFSYLLFRKSKHNYAENLVLNLYLLCGKLVISFLLTASMLFSDNKNFLVPVNYFVTALIFVYVLIFYYQYFSVYYTKRYQLIIRVITVAILYLVTKQIANDILNLIGLEYF